MAGEEDEKIEVDLEMRGYLAEGAEAAARAMDNLAKNTKQANRQLLMFDKRATKAAESATKLAAAAELYSGTVKDKQLPLTEELSKATKKYSDEAKKATKETEKGGKEADKAAKKVNTLKKVWTGFGKGLQGTWKVLRFTGMAVGILSAALGAAGLVGEAAKGTQAVLGIVGSLAHLAAFAALVPTALGAMALTMMTLKVATSGVGTALAGVFSGKATKAQIMAMKGLSQNAKAFIAQVVDFRPKLEKLKTTVQDALFKPMVAGFGNLLKVQIPLFQTGMTGISAAFGNIGATIIGFFSSLTGQRTIADLFLAGKQAVEAFGQTVKPIMQGLSDVIHTVGPLWDTLTKKFANAGGEFGAWLTKISQSGQLTTWLDQAMTVAGQLWGIFKGLGDIFGGLIKAIGTDGLSAIGNIIGLVAKFMQSFTGQAAVADFFAQLGSDAKYAAPLFQILGKALEIIGPAIQSILQGLAPGLLQFLGALVDAVGGLGPMWGPLAQAIGQVLIALIPLLPLLGQIVSAFGFLAANVLQELAAILTPIIETLVPPLVAWFKLLGDIFQAEGPVIAQVFKAFIDGFNMMAPVMKQVADVFSKDLNQFLMQFIGFLAQNAPQLEQMAFQFGDLASIFMQSLLPLLPQLIDAFFQLLDMLVKNAPVLMKMADGFMNILIQLAPMIPYIVLLAFSFIYVITWVLKALSVFGDFASGAVQAGSQIIDWFKGTWNTIKELIINPIQGAIDIIMPLIHGVESAFDGVKKAIKDLPSIGGVLSAINPFKFAGGPVSAGQKYTVGEIGRELFVPNGGGSPTIIGAQGMETRSFSTSGTIIPSYVLDAMDRFERGMSKSAAQQTQPAMAGARPMRGGDTNHYNFDLSVGDNVSQADIVAIEKRVQRGLEKAMKNQAERRGEN